MLTSVIVSGQYQWKLRDPLDLDVIDFGDNKVLLYNGLGIGLAYLLDGDNPYKDDEYDQWELGVSWYKGYRPELQGSLIQLAARRRFLLRKYLVIGIEARVLTYVPEPVIGLGFSPTFSWYIINKSRFRLAYDNGVGPNLFASAFPEGGTSFNFSTFYGFKLEALLGGKWYHFSVSNLHISNADIKGRVRNPPLDGIGLSISVGL